MIFLNKWAPLLSGCVVFLLYLSTLAPTISHTDSGELTAACFTFGVAHPTGYPLFTILGGISTHLPLGSPAFNLNLMAALCCAAAVWMWGKTAGLLFDSWKVKMDEKDLVQELKVMAAKIGTVVVSSLGLGIGLSFWAQGTSGEVYSLHALLLATSLFTFFRALLSNESTHKPWICFAVSISLLFANHLSAVVLLPGIAWLFFKRFGLRRPVWTILGKMAGVMIALLVIQYAWLPIRAGSDVALAWGNPQNWDSFWHHVSGRQFSVWFFTGMDAFKENLSAFLTRLPLETGPALLLLVPSFPYLWRHQRSWSVFFSLSVLVNVIWACNYAIKDLEPYFLLAYMSLSLVGGFGMRWLWLRFKVNFRSKIYISMAIGLGLGGWAFWNHGSNNQRGAWQYLDYTNAGLQSLPPNSILISGAWDVLVSPSYYLQHVEGKHRDITVLDYPMLQNRHWYPDHIRRNSPALAQALGNRLTSWEQVVADFDLRGITDFQALNSRFSEVFRGILGELNRRPVYISPDIRQMIANPNGGVPFPPGLTLVPEQYFYRVLPIEEAQTYRSSPLAIFPLRHHPAFGIPEDKTLVGLLGTILQDRIRYAEAFGQIQDADVLRGLIAGLPRLE